MRGRKEKEPHARATRVVVDVQGAVVFFFSHVRVC